MATFRRIANLFRRTRLEGEIAAELRAHIDLRTDDNIARGMTPEEARREALLQFGNPLSTRERVASADAALGLEQFWWDVRYAARQLRKSPGFTITAVVTLSLGIGVNTAGFSNMDAVVLHPLAVPELNRVVIVDEQQSRGGSSEAALANFEDWRRQSRSFEEMAVVAGAKVSLTGAGDAAHVDAALSSASFFSVLRTPAMLGRVFSASECQPGRDGVAVLNYGFWERRFGSDPAILGRKIQLDGRAFTMIGVMPKTMQYPSIADLYLPFAPTHAQLANRSDHNYQVVGRLRQGVTVKQAQAEMRTIAEDLARDNPATNAGWSVKVEPLLDGINGDVTPLYYRMVMGATLFVLLVVCANVANLQLARGIARRPEIAMRSALGASRWRIVRQLLTENAMLGLMGAVGGIAVAAVYLHFILANMPARVARHMAGWSNTSLNGRTLVFSLLLALGAGLIAGLMPAMEALRVNPAEQMKAGARTTTGSRQNRLRGLFAVAQISLAVALVIGAALISKGMGTLLHRADAYHPEKVLTFNVTLPASRYDTPQKKAAWYAASLDKIGAILGVSGADVTSALPYSGNGWNRDFEIEGRPAIPGKYQSARRLAVSSGYFSALKIGLIAGRGFNQGDSLTSVPVTIVSRRFVDRYFADRNPLGHRIRMSGKDDREPWLTIVGVAEETSYSMWDQSASPAAYVSVAQVPPSGITFALFTDGNPQALAAPVRKALAALDPALPLDMVETYQQYLHEMLTGLLYATAMMGIDALIALLLSAIGIFAVMANLVGERTREIGVRLAMGARHQDVMRLILRRAAWLTAAGLSTGLLMAYGLAHTVANLLRGVRPDDPVVFAAITLTIAAVALASSWIPARRATRVDPMQALRSE